MEQMTMRSPPSRTKTGSSRRERLGAPAAVRPAEAGTSGTEAGRETGYCVEVGAVRVYVDTIAEVHAVLEPLLQFSSQKKLAQLLGISTRTLHRWRHSGRLPPAGGGMLAEVVGRLGTQTGSAH
jgi:6-phosphogluconate dehydrogenase (decarboxylating)